MSADLMKARRKLREAENELNKILRRDYPAGSPIKWEWGGHIFCGTVVWVNDWGDRLMVRNVETGRERVITSYNIAQAMTTASRMAAE